MVELKSNTVSAYELRLSKKSLQRCVESTCLSTITAHTSCHQKKAQ